MTFPGRMRLFCLLYRSASVWREHPGFDARLRVRSAGSAQALAQAQSEGSRAVRTHAAVAERPAERGEAHGHEADGKER